MLDATMLPAAPPTLIEMTRELVRIPSRAGVDSFVPIVDNLTGWLARLRLPWRVLHGAAGCPMAVVSWVPEASGDTGSDDRTLLVLNATFDTAGFGDESAWSHAPTGAEVVDGWLYGRGAADCKAGIAIFAHVAATLAAEAAADGSATEPKRRLILLFDGDEHAGSFTGARAFFEGPDRPGHVDGVMIGYPGNERLVVGSRGFLRVRLVVHGLAAHSGSVSHRGINAIEKAGRLVERLAGPLAPADSDFGLPPQATVTSIAGGEGFSSVPDRCEIGVDVRLTPRFDRDAAERWLGENVGSADAAEPGAPTEIIPVGTQPAFQVSGSEPFVAALRKAAGEVFGRSIPTAVVGPSSIGNYLATLGIPATAGFGVTFQGIHAPDERVELASLEPVYQTYLRAVRALAGRPHRGAAVGGA